MALAAVAVEQAPHAYRRKAADIQMQQQAQLVAQVLKMVQLLAHRKVAMAVAAIIVAIQVVAYTQVNRTQHIFRTTVTGTHTKTELKLTGNTVVIYGTSILLCPYRQSYKHPCHQGKKSLHI